MAKVNPVPLGKAGATPYLSCADATAAIAFYERAFGATQTMRFAGPDGRIGHAELEIGAATIMLADEHPELDFRSPRALGGSPVAIHVYVPDVDAFAARAEAAGATITRAVADQFYGDRSVQLVDPFGHRWSFATHVEDVTNEELQRRFQALMSGGAS